MTECNTKTRLDFHPKLPVELQFSAPDISTDGGLLLLRQAEDEVRVCELLAALMPDERDPKRVKHTRREQVEQRVFQIAMGYEDCNDAHWLRHSPLWKTIAHLLPDDEQGLSSQPTLSRFENAVDDETVETMHYALMATFVKDLPQDIEHLILDLDSTAVEGHGSQQELFFNAYHDAHIFHPLVIIDGDTGQLISAVLRPGNVGDARDAEVHLEKLIGLIKALRPGCAVCVRGDAGFATPALYECLERLDAIHGEVFYLFGISKNAVLLREMEEAMQRVREADPEGSRDVRQFRSFMYRAKSWKKKRYIIGKAERTKDKDNPRFLVTNLTGFSERVLYGAYCMRAVCELHIDELKNHLGADRMSCSDFIANSFRLILYQAAYRLMWHLREKLRRWAEHPSGRGLGKRLASMAKARFSTLRLRILKLAVIVKRSARRIFIQGPAQFAFADIFLRLLDPVPG